MGVLLKTAAVGVGVVGLALIAYERAGSGQLAQAAAAGDLARVKALLAAGADPNGTQYGFSALFHAVNNGNVKMVKMLVGLGADVNKASWDVAPLYLAVKKRYKETMRALLEAGADPNATHKGQMTALLMAACHGDLELVDSLLAAKADVNQCSERGVSPLYAASVFGYVEIARLLVAAGANVNVAEHEFGLSPLLIAAHAGHKTLVKLLLAAGADINYCSKRPDAYKRGAWSLHVNDVAGFSPLCLAVANNHVDVVLALIIAKADVNKGSPPPLLRAIQLGSLNMTKILLRANAKTDTAFHGESLVSLAAKLGHEDIVRALVEAAKQAKPSFLTRVLSREPSLDLSSPSHAA